MEIHYFFVIKVCVLAHGCAHNQGDARIAMALLENSGFELTESLDAADVVVLFTCIVKGPTERRMVRIIQRLKNKPLVVAGCMPMVLAERIWELKDDAVLLGVNSVHKVCEAVRLAIKHEKAFFNCPMGDKNLYEQKSDDLIEIVPISEGCLGNCTYCIVKLARGNLRSYDLENIVNHVERAVKSGKKEIRICSEDTGAYGLDKGTDICELLNEILERVEGEYRIRIGMMNVNWALKYKKELARILKDERVYDFVHLPVQSGSDDVLRDMRRAYRARDFVEVVNYLRRKIPLITIETDVIVGYPTESEEDFERTLRLLRETKPNIVNISKFEARPFTEACKLKPLRGHVIKRRSREVTRVCKEIALENNKKLVGKEIKALLLGRGKKGGIEGRLQNYRKVIVRQGTVGSFVNVKVVEAHETYLKGMVQTF